MDDVVIVGAGIAGASLAYELSARRSVILLERESRPGYHSTGRSAAMLITTYGTKAVQQLTMASRSFFESPRDGFSDVPLLSPRGYLRLAREDQLQQLAVFENQVSPFNSDLRRLDRGGVLKIAPLIDPGYPAAGLLEPNAMAIDDSALHQGFLKGFSKRGGLLVTDAEVLSATVSAGGRWKVETKGRTFEAAILVNAAGGWGDEFAELCGVPPIGLQPKRRTAILLDPPDVDSLPGNMPMVSDIDDEFYVKPEGGALMVSPADETPVSPSDVQPEELDVAIAVDRYETLTGLRVQAIRRRWAGLRSFVSDHSPVMGFDSEANGFFWLVGQGGFGMMTAPGAAMLAACVIENRTPPSALGGLAALISPNRLRCV